MDKLELVANALIEREKLDKSEFSSLIENGFIPDKEEDIAVAADESNDLHETEAQAEIDENITETEDVVEEDNNQQKNEE